MICEVDAELTIDEESKLARMRWIREHEDGKPAIPDHEDGEWRFMSWGPLAMFVSMEETVEN